MKRNEWAFDYSAADLANAAAKKRAHHAADHLARRAARGREVGVARAAGVAPAEVVPAASCVAMTTYEAGQARERIDEDTSAYHNEAWTLNPPSKRFPRQA